MAELKGELARRQQAPGAPRRSTGDLLAQLELAHDLELEASEVQVVLDVPAFVPNAYVADAALKIDCYRKLASAEREADLETLREELADRYGAPPVVLDNLIKLRRLRLRAAAHGVLKIGRQDKVLQLRCRDRRRLEAGVAAHRELLRPIDTHMLYVRMPDPSAGDVVQLDLLLALLAPAPSGDVAAASDLGEHDRATLRGERKRRLRARAARDARPRGRRRRT